MTNTLYTLLAIVILFATGCSKELEIDIPYPGDKLVLLGYAKYGEPLRISLQYTQPVLDTFSLDFLTNADVKLWQNDTFVSQLTYKGNSIYGTEYLTDTIHEYHITATAAGYPPVKSTKIKIPSPPKATFGNFYIDATCELYDFPCLYGTLTITDDALTDDTYSLEILTYYSNSDYSYYAFDFQPVNFVCADIGSNTSLDGGNRYFKDLCFNGKTIQIRLRLISDNYPQHDSYGNDIFFSHHLLKIHKLDYNLYRQESTPYIEEGFFQIFTPATNTYSNIESGYGIFGAYSTYETVWVK